MIEKLVQKRSITFCCSRDPQFIGGFTEIITPEFPYYISYELIAHLFPQIPTDTEFWVDYGIARRVCMRIEKIRHQEPTLIGRDNEVRPEIDRLLAALVSLGVPEARQLEENLIG